MATYIYIYINIINIPSFRVEYVYVIARVGVKFGINFTSVRLSGNKIARGGSRVLFATQPNTSEICPGNFMTNRAIKD